VAATGVDLKVVDAQDRFLDALAGITDPEEKRKVIGREFIRVFEQAARDVVGSRGDDEHPPRRRLGRQLTALLGGREPAERQGCEQEAEVAQRDVAVAADEQEVENDARQPGGDDVGADPRPDQHDESGCDLHDADHVQRL
jgi:hypothetical protein